jgi:hypothetical protein
MIRLLLTLCLALVAQAERSSQGLVVLYTFAGDEGDVVVDRSGYGEPLHLQIANSAAVARGEGSLILREGARIESANAAKKVIDAVRKSGAFSAEVWLRAANTSQEGPARVVSISSNTSTRNFTLGQEGNVWDFRLRSSRSDRNGIPSLRAPAESVDTTLAHIVYTRARDGQARLYKNGQEIASQRRDGDLRNWDGNYRLMLGNEGSGDRPWQGELFLVALFDQSFDAQQVQQHFEAGPGAVVPAPKVAVPPAPSTDRGAIALYDFRGQGAIIQDQSGNGNNLRIHSPNAVQRRAGELEIRDKARIHAKLPALTAALREANALSIEAWIQPADGNQKGPARIVSLSLDPMNRNFTLGQDGDKADVRLRTPQTSSNGTPSLSARGLGKALTHVVYTRDRRGTTRIYLDGKKQAEGQAGGDFSNWDANYELALGSELTGDRPWKGALHMVALYARALEAREVQEHFAAGSGLRPEPSPALAKRLFVEQVAPIIAKHCLECHDASTQKGDLDLSRREAILAGGESGPAIVPGKHRESLLWESVAEDEMPKKRPPLSAEEKAALRQWLDAGGDVALPSIDPAVYVHGGQTGERWVQRLTVSEYIATVQATLGVDIGKEARRILPKDLRADGFSNTAYNLNVDFKHIDAYAQLATRIVQKVDLGVFLAEFADVDAIGGWLLRGPLDVRERNAYLAITDAVRRTGGDERESLRFVIEAMLQSPRFLYRVEDQQAGKPSAYELAVRLSYIVWGAPPDRALYAAAKAGQLGDEAAISAQTSRMLEDPRAVARSREFVAEWLNLGRLASLQPSRTRFPNWNPALAADMREETLAFFEDVVWKQQRPLADLLRAPMTQVSPRLATHYGPKPRLGLLMQGSLLTVGGDEASMVTRGLFVMHELLRGVVKAPPPCVDTTPVPSKPGRTQRAVALERINDRSCGGCHAKFEPLAFGLEHFNGIGAYHERDEHGNALRDDGEILVPGAAKAVVYTNATELMETLAESPRVQESLTWKVAQFALGRPLGGTDVLAIHDIHERAQKAGGTYPALILAIVTSDLVR